MFVADKLSDQNKAQLDQLGVEWVELRNKKGFRKFKEILDKFEIPNKDFNEKKLDEKIEKILNEIFQ